MRLEGMNHEDAEDIASEAMAKVWQQWDRIKVMKSAEGYLFTTAYNSQRSLRRRMKSGLKALGTWRARAAGAPDPWTTSETRLILVPYLRALPVTQRKALVLTEWVGLSQDEVAGVLGVTRGTVAVLRGRAKTRIKELWEKPDE